MQFAMQDLDRVKTGGCVNIYGYAAPPLGAVRLLTGTAGDLWSYLCTRKGK